MKQKNVWILSGTPGSGKSHFVKSRLGKNDVWVSRDAIRFSIVPETEEYFSKENEVVRMFYETMNKAIENPKVENVYIDATHLNTAARLKTIKAIAHTEYIEKLNCVHINTPLAECLRRNELREGRSVVPATVVRKMFSSYAKPTEIEGFDHYYVVDYQTDEIKEVSI